VAFANNVPAFMLSGFYASVTDRYGRKWGMLTPFLGYMVYVSILLYITLRPPETLEQTTLITSFAAFFLGLSGSFATFQMASFAYAADITVAKVEERGYVFSLIECCLFLAKIVGPIGAGAWAQKFGFIEPLAFSLILAFSGAVFVCFLPEKPRPQDPPPPLTFNPFSTVMNLYLLFQSFLSPLPFLSFAFFLYFASYMGGQQIVLLYLKHQFCWGPAEIGYYDTAEGKYMHTHTNTQT